MAIKTMNTAVFDKITENIHKEEIQKEECMSEADVEYLFEKGVQELQSIDMMLGSYINFISETFCGADILSVEEVTDSMHRIAFFINTLIPAILEGDTEQVLSLCDDNMTEDEVEVARSEFYNKLYEKYIKS